MISSRAQFGVYGAAIPLVLVIVMYLGFAATGTVLSGQAVNQIVGTDEPAVGILVFGVLTALVATLGYRYIHAMGRVSTVVSLHCSAPSRSTWSPSCWRSRWAPAGS